MQAIFRVEYLLEHSMMSRSVTFIQNVLAGSAEDAITKAKESYGKGCASLTILNVNILADTFGHGQFSVIKEQPND